MGTKTPQIDIAQVAADRWNAEADVFNQWDALGQDEKDELISAEQRLIRSDCQSPVCHAAPVSKETRSLHSRATTMSIARIAREPSMSSTQATFAKKQQQPATRRVKENMNEQ